MSKTAKVYLAGAGPGDPDLITVKLQRLLAIAEVIITDRLVNPQIIESYASKDCLIIQAGKQGYSNYSKSQAAINDLIIEHALQGKTVLRLKGGDVAFFSNVLDELKVLKAHKIPYEIIPGITAASGASAYAGIPLTARDHAQGVQWITFNPNSYYPDLKWKELASSEDTLVFYMAAKNLAGMAKKLLDSGADPTLPLVLVEQATTIYQRVSESSLQNCAEDFAAKKFSSPSLIIVGKVTQLHRHYQWFETSENTGSVFPQLKVDY